MRWSAFVICGLQTKVIKRRETSNLEHVSGFSFVSYVFHFLCFLFFYPIWKEHGSCESRLLFCLLHFNIWPFKLTIKETVIYVVVVVVYTFLKPKNRDTYVSGPIIECGGNILAEHELVGTPVVGVVGAFAWCKPWHQLSQYLPGEHHTDEGLQVFLRSSFRFEIHFVLYLYCSVYVIFTHAKK